MAILSVLHTLKEKGKNMRCNGVIHKVSAGETLYIISKIYGVRLKDIMEMNPYVNIYNLQVGEEICIPVSDFDDEKNKRYITKQGDDFKKLTQIFDTSIDRIFENNNGLYSVRIPAGTVIEMNYKR